MRAMRKALTCWLAKSARSTADPRIALPRLFRCTAATARVTSATSATISNTRRRRSDMPEKRLCRARALRTVLLQLIEQSFLTDPENFRGASLVVLGVLESKFDQGALSLLDGVAHRNAQLAIAGRNRRRRARGGSKTGWKM